MSKTTAQQLSEYLNEHHAALGESLLAALPAPLSAETEELCRDWLDSHVAFFANQRDRSTALYAKAIEICHAKKQGIEVPLYWAHKLRDAFIALCQEQLPQMDPCEISRLILLQADRQEKQFAEFWGQYEHEMLSFEIRRRQSYIDTSEHGLVIINMQGIIRECNHAFVELLSSQATALIGSDINTYCDEETQAELRRFTRKKRTNAELDVPGVFLNSRQESCAVFMRMHPLFDAEGHRDGCMVMTEKAAMRQFTAKKQLFDALTQSFLAPLPYPTQILDPQGKVCYTNPYFESLPEEVFPRTEAFCCSVHLNEYLRDTRCACEIVVETGKHLLQTVDLEVNGQKKWFNCLLTPFYSLDQQQVEYVVCVIDDITDHEQVEMQLTNELLSRQDQSLTLQVAVTVAQQLRNPLGVVIGFAELLNKGVPPDEASTTVDRILRNSLRCKEIIDGLLQFGKAFPGDNEAADLTQLISARVSNLLPLDKRDCIRWDLPKDPVMVMCVPDQLIQVLLHLLQNALRAATAEVLVQLSVVDHEAHLAISDDGAGIAEEIQRDIFKPFFTTHKDEGAVGLGLSLSQSVLEEYGGTLTVQTGAGTPLGGATFIARLPLHREQLADEKENDPLIYRLLIVDDETDLAEMLTMILRMKGHHIDIAGSGREALERLQHQVYDALVLDVRLPGEMNGPQIYEYVHKNYPALAKRTLFITADTMSYETRRFLDQVKRPSLEKPFLVQDFSDKIESLF